MMSDYDKRLLNSVEKIKDALLENELEFFSECKKKESLTLQDTRTLNSLGDRYSDRTIAFSNYKSQL